MKNPNSCKGYEHTKSNMLADKEHVKNLETKHA